MPSLTHTHMRLIKSNFSSLFFFYVQFLLLSSSCHFPLTLAFEFSFFSPLFLNVKVWITDEASLVAQLVKNLPAMQEILVGFLGQKVPWRSDRLPTPVFLGFAGGSKGKKSSRNVGDLDLIPGLGRSPEERNSYTLQYFCLENSMDRGPRTEEPGRLQSMGSQRVR